MMRLGEKRIRVGVGVMNDLLMATRPPARKPVEVGTISHYLYDCFIHPRWCIILLYHGNLVGGVNTSEKYLSDWIISPGRVENEECLRPPSSNSRSIPRIEKHH